MDKLEIIGTKEHIGIINASFYDAYCVACDGEVYNIPICRASLCPFCEAVLLPCFVCEEQFECELSTELWEKYKP